MLTTYSTGVPQLAEIITLVATDFYPKFDKFTLELLW